MKRTKQPTMTRTNPPAQMMRRKPPQEEPKEPGIPHGGRGGFLPDPPANCTGFVQVFEGRRFVDITCCKNKCAKGMAKECPELKEYYKAWRRFWECYEAKREAKYGHRTPTA